MENVGGASGQRVPSFCIIVDNLGELHPCVFHECVGQDERRKGIGALVGWKIGVYCYPHGISAGALEDIYKALADIAKPKDRKRIRGTSK